VVACFNVKFSRWHMLPHIIWLKFSLVVGMRMPQKEHYKKRYWLCQMQECDG
jgi:hypothetical protein